MQSPLKIRLYALFCYLSAAFFILLGAGVSVYLLDMFFYAENGVLVASILLPFSIILIIMGIAVFKFAGRILNPAIEIEDTEE